MYYVTPVLLTIIALYCLSYFFFRNRKFTIQLHFRFWNLIIAALFLLTAATGLLRILHTAPEWDAAFLKSMAGQHVVLGMAFISTGLLHFFLHYSRFRNLFKKRESDAPNEFYCRTQRTRGAIGANLFAVGFVSSAIQLLLLREILNISGGYELIAGTFLGSWLMASAAGSAIAPKTSITNILSINLLFFSGPVISVFLLIILSRLFLNPGETPSYLASIIFTLIVLVPFCFISGFTFIKLVSEASSIKDFRPGRSFAVETSGGIAAGILISFASHGGINNYQAIILIIISGFSYTVISQSGLNRRNLMLTGIIVLALSAGVIISAPDKYFRQLLLRGLTITDSSDTPYGNITRGMYGEEKSTYYDHRLLFYSDDIIEREEDIHYPMLQLDNPEAVLLVSGSLYPHLGEINKYKKGCIR